MLERAPVFIHAHPEDQFHAARGGFGPLADKPRQARQRVLQAHRQKIHALLQTMHHLQRVAQTGRPGRSFQPVAPTNQRRPGAQCQPPPQVGHAPFQLILALHDHFGGGAGRRRADIRRIVAQGRIDLVAHGRYHGNARPGNGAHDDFLVETP